MMDKPFATLEITDGVRKDKTMASADRFNNTAGNIILPATGVGLVHSVELSATALSLECVRIGYLNRE